MARKYYKKRYYRSKGKWSANIKTFKEETITAVAGQSFFSFITLCRNPVQSDTTVSQQYTVKNIELSYEIDTSGNDGITIESLTVYIMYVPQGMTVTENYPNEHPEYIMAYRFRGQADIEQPSGSAVIAPVSTPGRLPSFIKTRMARRLQTGDKVIMLITGNNESISNSTIYFNGLVRWWTKAN